MLVAGDLGFLVVLFVFFSLGVPVISFLVQWRWKIAQERKEEIMRLVEMASEEAARAEVQGNVEFGVGGRVYQCAICYCPTTTRCSRCKAVRYCSGKCQIIHWRKGHKEECQPRSTIIRFNGMQSDFDQVLWHEEPHDFHVKDLETEGNWCAKPTERFPQKSIQSESSVFSYLPTAMEDGGLDSHMDTRRVINISELSSSSSLFGYSDSATSNDSLNGSHVGGTPVPGTLNRSKRPLSYNVAPYVVKTINDVYDSNAPYSEFTGSVNTVPLSRKLKPKMRSPIPGVIGCGSTSFSGSSMNDLEDCTTTCSSDFRETTHETSAYINDACDSYTQFSGGAHDTLSASDPLPCFPQRSSTMPFPLFNPRTFESDDAYPTSVANKIPANGACPMEKIVPSASTVRPVIQSGCSDSVDSNHINDSQQLGSKGRRSLSSITSEHHPCSNPRRHSVSALKPLNSSETASSIPNHSNGLKTSVRKVVQQLRAPKISIDHSLGTRREVTEKNNYKMLFSYDLFIKLYNWEKVELRPCGFTNCGNTCYANAVLQCLAFTQPLTAYLLQGIHSKACSEKEWCFTCEFECLILKASKGGSPLSPIGIVSRIQSIGSHLSHGKEEDAHEFLRCAIDNMQSVCLKEAGLNALSSLAEETTLLGLIFGGYLRSKIKCMKCHGKSEQHERMMDLTVEIQGDILTLDEALRRFTATEILDGENKYHCSRCKSYEKAKKKLTVLEAPNILTIAFKRFQSGKFGKLNKSVRFPETLNLAPYMSGKSDKSLLYRLYAVVVHLDVMNAAFSGHYVCYIKNIQGNWFKVDDSRVKPVELERVLSKGAYMLLYSRCSPQPPNFTRIAIASNDIKSKRERCTEANATCHVAKVPSSRARLSSTIPKDSPSTAHRRPEDFAQWKTFDGLHNCESFDSSNGRFHHVNRIPRVNSLSDSSSLFSCSDEGSCSTESTRDSVSTDDFSDYIFGDSRCSWNSPRRVSEEPPDVSCSSFSRHSNRYVLCSDDSRRYPPNSVEQVFEEDAPFLYADKANYGRKVRKPTDSISFSSSSSSNSSSNGIDSEQLGRGYPFDKKSGVSLRRSKWEREAQPFY